MRTTRLLTASVTMLAAIGHLAFTTTAAANGLDCETVGGSSVTITYGITALGKQTVFEIKENVTVKKGKALMFRLKPKGNTPKVPDFKDAVVKIKGKPGSEWFTLIQGSYNGTADDHEIGICADTAPGSYEYEVVVEGLGTLDPRVIVE